MPWCPECKAEYREGFFRCSDCGVELVEKLPSYTNDEDDEEHFLMTVNNDFQANAVVTILESYNIPVWKKRDGYTDVIMGMSGPGIDLFVPDKLFQKSVEIIESKYEGEAIINKGTGGSEKEEFSRLGKELKKKRKRRVWFIIWFFIPGLIVFAALVLFILFKLIAK